MAAQRVGLKLKRLRERAGMTVRALAAAIGKSPTSYQYYEDEFKQRWLPVDLARDLAKALQGHGIEPPAVMALAGVEASEMGEDLALLTPERDRVPPAPIPGYVSIQVIDAPIGAGGGGLPDDNGEPQVELFRERLVSELRARVIDLRFGHIKGDSMAPVLESGDEILIDVSDTIPSPPGIFMVWDGYGLVARHVEPVYDADPPAVRLIPANAVYKTIERTVGDGAETRIYGRIVWFARRL